MPYGNQKRIREVRQQVRENSPAIKVAGAEKKGYGSGHQSSAPKGNKKA